MGEFVQVLRQNQIDVLLFLYDRAGQRATLDEIFTMTGLSSRGAGGSRLSGLVRDGYVRKVSRGVYELAPRGRRYVENLP